jgi:hypothetical protein
MKFFTTRLEKVPTPSQSILTEEKVEQKHVLKFGMGLNQTGVKYGGIVDPMMIRKNIVTIGSVQPLMNQSLLMD